MTVQAHTADRRLVVLAVLGVVLALTAAMWTLAGCAPKAEPSAPAASEQKDGNGGIGYVKYSIDFLSKAAIQSNDAEELGS